MPAPPPAGNTPYKLPWNAKNFFMDVKHMAFYYFTLFYSKITSPDFVQIPDTWKYLLLSAGTSNA